MATVDEVSFIKIVEVFVKSSFTWKKSVQFSEVMQAKVLSHLVENLCIGQIFAITHIYIYIISRMF